MLEKVRALRNRYRIAETDKEQEEIQRETEILMNEDPDAFAEAMVECMRETNRELDKLLIKVQLKEVSKIISISYLAKNYFKKTPQWFYQRLNENLVNSKPAKFTEEEIKTLNFALQDISKKIGSVRVS